MQNVLNLVFTAGILIMIGTMMFRSHHRRRQMVMEEQAARKISKSGPLKNSSTMIDQLEVRLYDFEREVSARIDNKLLLLDKLIIEAQAESNRLEQLLEKANEDNKSQAA